MKASENIDCTCTVASISSISRFACAKVWSVRVLTKSIYVTFVGVCVALVNICQKKNIEKKEKIMKMRFVFYSKVIHVHVYEKSGILVCNVLVSCDFRVGPVSQSAILQFFFTLVQQRLSKAYAINCSCFATGAQNTLYKQQKKERTKISHLWPHFLVILNSPVQFFPFPVYPGWQSHTCDPLVLVQFASSWQEWFPLHSSMSMKSQMKKWDFRIMQKLTCISHYCVEECKPWLLSTFCWIARTRDCRTWWKKLSMKKPIS